MAAADDAAMGLKDLALAEVEGEAVREEPESLRSALVARVAEGEGDSASTSSEGVLTGERLGVALSSVEGVFSFSSVDGSAEEGESDDGAALLLVCAAGGAATLAVGFFSSEEGTAVSLGLVSAELGTAALLVVGWAAGVVAAAVVEGRTAVGYLFESSLGALAVWPAARAD